ncbi:MAG: glycogen synthase [Anaerolineales bacterium]|nr:glycogen synthase [Anaerolineales bacterium]
MPATLNVLFLAAEASPFVKVGGLADVAGSLPLALRNLPPEATRGLELDVRLILPLHRSNRADTTTMLPVASALVYRRGGSLMADVYQTSLRGMPVYFLTGDPISNAPTVYSSDAALDREKYAFFSLAILEVLRKLDWQPDILHANDWHTALALYALRSRRADPVLARIRTVLTLHNLPYMGGDSRDILSAYGLMPLQEKLLPDWAQTQPLPLGLWAADVIVPVSPTYAREILTPEFGHGLETYLRSRADTITGILNGIDTTWFDPARDDALPYPFDVDHLEARAQNKEVLQKTLDLPIEAETPVIGMVTRIDQQKGIDLALRALARFGERPWQFVLLGTGDPSLENNARNLQTIYPDRVRIVLRYDDALARLIYGGADCFLMPSRYEPCGLAQMIAMRYGCIPIVHATGGLKDTVQEGKTGFLFHELTPEALLEALERAFKAFANQEKWWHLQRNAMAQDFGWERSARQYALLYRSLVNKN